MPLIDPNTTSGIQPNIPGASGYALAFSDEFTGSSLDPKWQVFRNFGDFAAPSNWRVNGGYLEVWPDASTGYQDWTLRSTGSPSFANHTYGVWETRVKLCRGRGIFPAFWAYKHPDADPQAEIDIFEAYGYDGGGWNDGSANGWRPTNAAWTIWRDGGGGGLQQSGTLKLTDGSPCTSAFGSIDLTASFYTYTLLWEPSGLTFFFNGQQWGCKTGPIWSSSELNGQYGPCAVVYDLWFRKAGLPEPDSTNTPSGTSNAMQIDYIRVWHPQGSTPAPAPAPSPTTVYVSTTGSDSNTGTEQSPFATITHASTVVTAGGEVVVQPGTYRGGFTTTKNGTSAGARVTYRSNGRHAAKLVHSATSSSDSGWYNTGNHVVIEGFEMDGSTYAAGTRWRIGMHCQAAGNIVRDCWVHHIWDSGAYSGSPPAGGGAGILMNGQDGDRDGVVDRCLVHHVGYSTNNNIQGIYLSQESSNCTNCIVHNIGAYAIHTYHDVGNNRIINNTIFNCTQGIINAAGGYYTTTPPISGVAVHNNIVFGCTNNGIREYQDVAGDIGTTHSYSNNNSNGNGTNYLFINGTASAAVTGSPSFVTYAADGTGDYRLLSASPCLNAGTATYATAYDYVPIARPQGVNVDVGAYELSAAATPVRLMPLGDSNTEGQDDNLNYRHYLSQLFDAQGTSIDFVGSMTSRSGNLPSNRQNHEGHSGWCSSDAGGICQQGNTGWDPARPIGIIERIDTWMSDNPADVVLLLVGGNDGDKNLLKDNIVTIVNSIHSANSACNVYVSGIKQSPFDDWGALNADIQSAVEAISATFYVYAFAGIDSSEWQSDNLHLNVSGYAKMARNWFNAISAPSAPAPFSATLSIAPPSSASLSGIVQFEVKGTRVYNCELLGSSGFSPVYGVFSINSGKTIAGLNWDTRNLSNSAYTVRIVAFDVTAGEVGSSITVMQPRLYYVSNVSTSEMPALTFMDLHF